MHPRPSPPLPNSRNRCSVLRLVSRLSPGLGRSSSAQETLSAKSAFSRTRDRLHWLKIACGGHGLTGLAACDRATLPRASGTLAVRPRIEFNLQTSVTFCLSLGFLSQCNSIAAAYVTLNRYDGLYARQPE